MTTREKALLASSPGITVLVVALGWYALDPKGDARQHGIDRAVRWVDALRGFLKSDPSSTATEGEPPWRSSTPAPTTTAPRTCTTTPPASTSS